MGGLDDVFGGDNPEPSDLQTEILAAAERNRDMSNAQLAEVAGCSESYVSETLREFGDPRDGDGSDGSGGGLGDLLG